MGIAPIADNRADHDSQEQGKIMQRTWGIKARVDPTVTFEEFAYWATVEREDEKERNRLYVEKRGPVTMAKVIKNRFSKGVHHDEKKERDAASQAAIQVAENKGQAGADATANEMRVTPEEWQTAARALKTTSWGTIFFLITTDILGWSSCP